MKGVRKHKIAPAPMYFAFPIICLLPAFSLLLLALLGVPFPLKDIAAHLNMNPNYLNDILKRLET